jgi:hypothetical protein
MYISEIFTAYQNIIKHDVDFLPAAILEIIVLSNYSTTQPKCVAYAEDGENSDTGDTSIAVLNILYVIIAMFLVLLA